MKRKIRLILLPLMLAVYGVQAFGQSGDYSLRSSVNLEVKVFKNLDWEITPEFRLDPLGGQQNFLAQTGFNYKVASWLGFGISYRLEGTKAPAAESASSTMSYSNRFAIDASSKFDLDRFTPKLRVRFSNFTDFDSQTEDRTNYLRYRLGLGYNIKGIKLNPYLLAEFYQKTSTGLFSKGKYTAGLSYDFNKHHTLSAEYSYADKFSNLTKYHIFEIGYSVKF